MEKISRKQFHFNRNKRENNLVKEEIGKKNKNGSWNMSEKMW